jgi:glycosyltransferase involved in cell wall biosynthesis
MKATNEAPSASPKVCIGVPIYNEAAHVEESLLALLAQDYANIEVIVSDNGSNDGTEAICRRIAEQDSRLRYLRQSENRGVIFNFEVVKREADSDYFMWASGHDLWSPGLISQCVAVMESDPNVVLAHGTCHWIDDTGQRLPIVSDRTDSRGMDVLGRVQTVFWGSMNPVLGLMRMTALDMTTATENSTIGNDLVLLSELALLGTFAHLPGVSFSRRLFRQPEHLDDRMKRFTGTAFNHRAKWIDAYFPLLRLPVNVIRAVLCAKLPLVDRLALAASLLASMPARYLVGRRAVR